MDAFEPVEFKLSPLTAEQQVLICALSYLERQSLPPTATVVRADVEAFGPFYFGMYCQGMSCQDGDGAFDSLAGAGLLALEDGRLSLTPSGVEVAQALRAEHPRHVYAYNEFYYRARRSPAHARFCEKVYGRDLCQHGMMDMAQLDELVALLREQKAASILEMGCGNGAVAAYIAGHTGVRVTGIDQAGEGIAWARELPGVKEAGWQFFTADMAAVDFPPESFDAVLIVDSVYFVPDLPEFLRRVMTFLRPGGKLYMHTSAWVADASERDLLAADGTHFAQALRIAEMPYSFVDYTSGEARHWQLKREVAEAMKAEFEAEGNGWLYQRRWIEAHCHQPYVEGGNVSRYLYVVGKATGEDVEADRQSGVGTRKNLLPPVYPELPPD